MANTSPQLTLLQKTLPNFEEDVLTPFINIIQFPTTINFYKLCTLAHRIIVKLQILRDRIKL